MENHVVLYDGECGMCNFVVQWLIREDRKQMMRFAPQQGNWVIDHFPEATSWNAVGYVRDEQLHIGFRAVQWMLIDLGGYWKVAGQVLQWIPAWIGNPVYRLIANHRKRFFKTPSCMLLSVEQRQRFMF